MFGAERRWAAAIAEHEVAIREFQAECEAIAPGDWQRVRAAGKWSPAAVALHVCRAYEFGREASAGGASMRMLVAPPVAWFARVVMLPVLLATGRFPRGARAPREVVPDFDEALARSQREAVVRLEQTAREAAAALRAAARRRPMPTARHAYFGVLTPYTAFRLLSAHTRHHARGLAAARVVATVAS